MTNIQAKGASLQFNRLSAPGTSSSWNSSIQAFSNTQKLLVSLKAGFSWVTNGATSTAIWIHPDAGDWQVSKGSEHGPRGLVAVHIGAKFEPFPCHTGALAARQYHLRFVWYPMAETAAAVLWLAELVDSRLEDHESAVSTQARVPLRTR